MEHRRKLPSITLHKPSGRPRVRIRGKDFYLGPFGSAEATYEYGIVVQRELNKVTTHPQGEHSVHEVVLAFLRHAKRYYAKKNGKPTAEYNCFKSAVRPLAHGVSLRLDGPRITP